MRGDLDARCVIEPRQHTQPACSSLGRKWDFIAMLPAINQGIPLLWHLPPACNDLKDIEDKLLTKGFPNSS